MPVTLLSTVIGGVSSASSTTLDFAHLDGVNIPAGSVVVACIASDTLGADPYTPTPTMPAGLFWGTWTQIAGTSTNTLVGTAGSGTNVDVFITTTIADSGTASTTHTITLDVAVPKKVVTAMVLQGATETLRAAVNIDAHASGALNVITGGAALVAGDVVVGGLAGESNAVPTGDTDTLNGSWSALAGRASSGGGAAGNVATGMQVKVVTATDVQTWSPTTAGDSCAVLFALIPLSATLAATSSGSLTLTGAGAAAAQLAAPAGLTATAVSATQIDLTWAAFSGATGYDIERNGSVIVLNNPTTAYSDTGLADNVQYNYRVRAVL